MADVYYKQFFIHFLFREIEKISYTEPQRSARIGYKSIDGAFSGGIQ